VIPLRLADALEQHLARRLRGDPPELRGVEFPEDDLAADPSEARPRASSIVTSAVGSSTSSAVATTLRTRKQRNSPPSRSISVRTPRSR
jgi:hypothetical protein